MLRDWGYVYLIIGTTLAYVEVDLENHRKKTGGAIAGHGTSTLDPEHMTAKFVLEKCDEILGLASEQSEDLEPIPTNIELLKAKIITARRQKPHNLELYTNDILQDVRRIRNDFIVLLSKRFFYYLRPDRSKYYGKPELFGELVAKKFKGARDDIERAGNCLALGEGTACIMHLMRALEVVVRQLARRLDVTISPKSTWGQILNAMDGTRGSPGGIESLPEKTEKQKRKKSQWSQCRANLWHVKEGWRDEAFHSKRKYTPDEAHEIMERVRAFMCHLATL